MFEWHEKTPKKVQNRQANRRGILPSGVDKRREKKPHTSPGMAQPLCHLALDGLCMHHP